MRVLSTKKLSLSQKELLLAAGATLVEYDAIHVSPIDFEAPEHIENAIFTSQNGVKTFFEQTDNNSTIEHVFCVGSKTKKLLEELGQNVIKMEQNASLLGNYLIKNYKNDTFWHFCGSRKREELSELLKSSKISLFEVNTYQTELNLKKIDQKFDGILFFSPSGVESYFQENSADEAHLICIGETTASLAKQYSNKVEIANSAAVESVIAKAVKILN